MSSLIAFFIFGAFGSEASTLIVTNLNDDVPGSLRQAISSAAPGDQISFAVNGTIKLTSGELLIADDLGIVGPGSTNLVIEAQRRSRVFNILSKVKTTISGLSLCNGQASHGAIRTSNNPAGGDGMDGGAIYNAGTLVMTDCVMSNCAAGNGGSGYRPYPFSTTDATNWVGGRGGRGGGIYNAGKTTLINCALIANSSGIGGDGGGVTDYGTPGSPAGDGGAIYNDGRLTLTGCSFEHNTTGHGGAAYSRATGIFEGVYSGGAGGNGGGIYDAGPAAMIMSDCQFSRNTCGAGGFGSAQGSPFAQPASGGSGGPGGQGAAVCAEGSLQLNNCKFLANHAGDGGPGGGAAKACGAGGLGGAGGAIFATGEINLTRCFFGSNTAGGGGVGGTTYFGAGGFGGNGGCGGGIYAAKAVRINNCALTGNFAGPGGQGGSVSLSLPWLNGSGGGRGGSGGALYCQSDLASKESTFSGNQAGDAGGPGYIGGNPSFSGQPSTSGSPGGEGGAIFGIGMLMLHKCTVSANHGGNGSAADWVGPYPRFGFIDEAVHPNFIWYERDGGPGGAGGTGGVHSENSLRMTLCTLSGNSGGAGAPGGGSWGGFPFEPGPQGGAGGPGGPGAVYCSPSSALVLVACTIAANSAGPGGPGGPGQPGYHGQSGYGSQGLAGVGGVCNANPVLSGSALNTLVASNRGADLQGSFLTLGHNLIGQTDGSSGFINGVNGDLAGSAIAPVQPLLGALLDNGGSTFTMALLHGSPALDAGDDALLRPPYSLSEDQRGFARKSGSHADIGAFEFQFPGADTFARGPTLSGGFSATNSPALRAPSDGRDATNPAAQSNFQLRFSDTTPGATFTVLASTNLSLPLNNWSVLGQAIQIEPNHFQFTDVEAANNPQRFYRVSSP